MTDTGPLPALPALRVPAISDAWDEYIAATVPARDAYDQAIRDATSKRDAEYAHANAGRDILIDRSWTEFHDAITEAWTDYRTATDEARRIRDGRIRLATP